MIIGIGNPVMGRKRPGEPRGDLAPFSRCPRAYPGFEGKRAFGRSLGVDGRPPSHMDTPPGFRLYAPRTRGISRGEDLALPERQPYLVGWVREVLLFARARGGCAFEQTWDMFLAEMDKRGDGKSAEYPTCHQRQHSRAEPPKAASASASLGRRPPSNLPLSIPDASFPCPEKTSTFRRSSRWGRASRCDTREIARFLSTSPGVLGGGAPSSSRTRLSRCAARAW